MSDKEQKQPADEKKPAVDKKEEKAPIEAAEVLSKLPYDVVDLIAEYARVSELASLQQMVGATPQSAPSQGAVESKAHSTESHEAVESKDSMQKKMQKVISAREEEMQRYVKDTLRYQLVSLLHGGFVREWHKLLLGGYVPDDLNPSFTATDPVTGKKLDSLIGVALLPRERDPSLGGGRYQKESFLAAERLRQLGAPLPKLETPLSELDNRMLGSYFSWLINTSKIDDIYLSLQYDQTFLTVQDDKGNTFLHYIVLEPFSKFVPINRRDDCELTLELIFKNYAVDFAIKNDQGKTPLELAAMSSASDEPMWSNVREIILPRFIQEAGKRHFDFSSLPYINGLTLLQFILVSLKGIHHGKDANDARSKNVTCLLESVPDLDVNAFSKEGNTAFYYVIKQMMDYVTYLDEAVLLLDHGADPTLSRNPSWDPVKEIQLVLDDYVAFVDDVDREQEERAVWKIAVIEIRKLQERVRDYVRNKEVKRAVSLAASHSTTTSGSALGSPLPSPSGTKGSFFSSSRSDSKGEKADAELAQRLREAERAELEKPKESGASQSENVGEGTQQGEIERGTSTTIKGPGSSGSSGDS